ncbi:hypothetical protein ACOTC5_30675 [Achromobacter xylosoxidans]
MIFTTYDPGAVKRPTALRLGAGSPTFKVFDSEGVMGWTNNDMMDIGIPKFMKDRVLAKYGEMARAPKLNTISVERLLRQYTAADGSHQALHSFELRPQAFEHDAIAPNPLARDRVVMVNEEQQLATRVDLRYFGYFLRTYKQARFFGMTTQVTNGSVAGAIAVVLSGRVVGLVSPVMTDGYALYRQCAAALRAKEGA